jgi:hypothetical protein
MAGSPALTDFRRLTLDSLQLGDEFVSDDHLVIPRTSRRTVSPWRTTTRGWPRSWRRPP